MSFPVRALADLAIIGSEHLVGRTKDGDVIIAGLIGCGNGRHTGWSRLDGGSLVVSAATRTVHIADVHFHPSQPISDTAEAARDNRFDMGGHRRGTVGMVIAVELELHRLTF